MEFELLLTPPLNVDPELEPPADSVALPLFTDPCADESVVIPRASVVPINRVVSFRFTCSLRLLRPLSGKLTGG